MDKEHFFKKAGVILETGPNGDHKGDCIFRTAHFAMTKNDYLLLFSCHDLLLTRRRWPVELDDPSGQEHRKKDGLGSMTRDPYIMFYAACVMMNKHHFIDTIKPPWYIYRPHFTAWRRYLRTGRPRYKKRYEFWARLGLILFTPPAYAVYLDAWMAWIARSPKIQELLSLCTPHWNYCLKQLIEHKLRHLDKTFIENYLPRKGFVWQAENMSTEPQDYLVGSDEYLMDREILLYVYNKNKDHEANNTKATD